MQINETVHGCPVGRRFGLPDCQVGDPGSPSQIRTTSGQPPSVAATGRAMYQPVLSCVDGPLRARAFLSHVGTLAVMCPAFLGGRLTAGPDGIRGSRPNQIFGG